MQAHYDAVTWLFVSRNFKDDLKDREAARTHDRFGVTSWPQLVLFDPRDDRVLAEMPRGFEPWVRELQPFRGAVPALPAADLATLQALEQARALAATDRAAAIERLQKLAAQDDPVGASLAARELLRTLRGDERTLPQRLQDPDVRERALALEAVADLGSKADAELVRLGGERLFDGKEHIVVRLRALAVVAKNAPQQVAAHASELLTVPNDAFRNLVLTQVAAVPQPALAPRLSELFAGAGTRIDSRNPNVLRAYVAKCLPGSGDATAIAAVAPLLREASVNNGTTGTVIKALGELARRLDAGDRQRAIALLLEGVPPAVADGADVAAQRRALARVKDLHLALATASGAELPAPPKQWSAADRDGWLGALRQQLVR